MELQQLYYLVTIEKEGTISKASKQLNISQPAITRSIQRLEDELGLSVFDRTKNRIAFNEDGLFVLKYAHTLIDDYSVFKQNIKNYKENKNKIIVASVAPAPLWGIDALYNGQMQGCISEDTEKLLTQFNNYEINLLILDYPIHSPDIKCLPLVTEQLYIGVKKNHPLADYKSITFQDLNGYPFLVSKAIGYWNEITRTHLNQSLLLYEDAEAYSLLSEMTDLLVFRTDLTIPLQHEDLIYIPIVDEDARLHFYIHYHLNHHNFDDLKTKIKSIKWKEIKIVHYD